MNDNTGLSMNKNTRKASTMPKFIFLNLLGIFMFFVPITIGGSKSIPIDHIVTFIRQIPYFGIVYAGIIIIPA